MVSGLRSWLNRPNIKNSSQKKDEEFDNEDLPIDSIVRLYNACRYNDIKYQLTPKYKVEDICIDQRTTGNFRRLLGKTILFIGITSNCGYKEKVIKLRCEGANHERDAKVALYLTQDDYWSIWNNKLSKFGEKGCGVKIACIAAFRSRIASYPDKRNNTQKEYTEYYTYVGLKQIKVLDRVHSSIRKTETI